MDGFKDEVTKLSYAMGMNMGEYLKRTPVETDLDAALEGINDYLAGKAKLQPEEYALAMQELQRRVNDAVKKQSEKLAAGNLQAEQDFLMQNRKKAGVTETSSGLQYQILKQGNGPKPKRGDTVRVHYTGTLLNGRTFDSSVDRGEPAEFGVSQVISGWTEALQLMNTGSKYRLFIPSRLAYGSRGAAPQIPPNAALIFEVELLAVL